MKTKLFITAVLVTAIVAAARAQGSDSKIAELKQEYQQTQKQVAEGQAHLLRLEGAIRILEIMDEETTATEAGTTQTKVKGT